jgi:hypothetical protein
VTTKTPCSAIATALSSIRLSARDINTAQRAAHVGSARRGVGGSGEDLAIEGGDALVRCASASSSSSARGHTPLSALSGL